VPRQQKRKYMLQNLEKMILSTVAVLTSCRPSKITKSDGCDVNSIRICSYVK